MRGWLARLACLLLVADALLLGVDGVAGDEGATWAYAVPAHGKREHPLLDLRALNEAVAGDHGYVRLDADGHFLRGDGQPMRFWGVIANAKTFSDAQWRAQASWLAAIGVNMVRHQVALPSREPHSAVWDANDQEIDQAWRMVASMRQQGIYTGMILSSGLSDYSDVDTRDWGIDGYATDYRAHPGAQHLWCVTFFNPRLREAYKARLKRMYLRPNPYTGIPLAQDASILFNQIQTEDSLLFYGVNGLAKPQLLELDRQYAAWLARRYQGDSMPPAAWDGTAIGANDKQVLPDDPAAGQIGLYNLWEMTGAGLAAHGVPSAGKACRLSDQIAFLAWTQHEFFSDMSRFFHDELHCAALILADNWRPVDPERLQDAERWTYMPGDIMAENRFFNFPFVGEATGWRVSVGDRFASRTALLPAEMDDMPPFAMKRVAGKAAFVTSTAWTFPDRFAAEGPMLSAAYGALTGMDGFCWEGFGSQPTVDTDIVLHINPATTWLMTWNCARPPITMTFPAAALLFRGGCLSEAEPVCTEARPLADLWSGAPAAIDDHGPPLAKPDTDHARDRLAFWAGPSVVRYDAPAAISRAPSLDQLIDRAHQQVHAATGELDFDYGLGVVRIHAPRAQGLVGFLRAQGPVDLGTVRIACDNEYAVILALALDGEPIASAHRILVQSTTEAVPSGWMTRPREMLLPGVGGLPQAARGEEVLSLGGPPWRVVSNRTAIRLRNTVVRRVVSLDSEGYRLGRASSDRDDAGLSFAMPAEASAVLVEQ